MDLVFLVLFAIEISIRILAMGVVKYLGDPWNCFDFLVVAVSWFFAIQVLSGDAGAANSSTTLALLRLLRLLRLVNGLRKLSGVSSRKKDEGLKGLKGLSFSSPVERVLEIFREIRDNTKVRDLPRNQGQHEIKETLNLIQREIRGHTKADDTRAMAGQEGL